MSTELMGPVQPWWRIRMLWLVVGGPAVVVVASFALLFVAVRGGDTPLLLPDAQPDTARAGAQAPATQARNHAVTPER